MEKVCGNCNFWERKQKNPHLDTEKVFGECHCPKFKYHYKTDGEPDDSLVYTDYECYHAYLSMGQNFGCIHFEPKP